MFSLNNHQNSPEVLVVITEYNLCFDLLDACFSRDISLTATHFHTPLENDHRLLSD